MELPVGVGKADIVVIDQHQPSDTCTTEPLRREAADPAKPEQGHTGFTKSLDTLVAD